MNQVGELLEKYQNMILEGFDPVSSLGYTLIPNLLLKSPHISNNAKVVYAKLLSYARDNKRCFPGQERMVEDIGTSQSTIARSIIELQKEGWLTVERRGQGKTNIYTLKYQVEKSMKVDISVNG